MVCRSTHARPTLFRQCTGRTQLPDGPVQRLLLLVGRRGGKDRFLSAVAVWRAALCADWRKHMSAGETATVLLLGVDKRQAAIMRRYCEGLLQAPLLAAEVLRCNDDVIEFRNGAALEINTNDAAAGPGSQRGCGAWIGNLLLARGRDVGVERRGGCCCCHRRRWRCVLTVGCWRLAFGLSQARLHVSPLAAVAWQRRQRRHLLARAVEGDEPEAAVPTWSRRRCLTTRSVREAEFLSEWRGDLSRLSACRHCCGGH